MVLRSDEELKSVWRALSSTEQLEGWRMIVLRRIGSCELHAARRFPGNEETLLVGFPDARLPPSRQLPVGRGFEVTQVKMPGDVADLVTIGLVREPAGSLELFETMAEDCIRVLERCSHATVGTMLEQFIKRVVAWQEFMQKPRDGLLSPEQEVGLVGELLTLDELVHAGVPAPACVQAWEGPIDGVHDFVLGPGAIEVKTSLAVAGFPAKIGSIEQLDDAFRQPLYLAAQRLAVVAEGETLPAMIDRLRALFGDAGGAELFDRRVMHAGYLDMHADSYTRTFALVQTRLLHVNAAFPRMTPAIVGPAIRRASYELDVDLVTAPDVALHDALSSLGAM